MSGERRQLLRECGAALYGPLSWKSPISRDLGVSYKTIQRWDDGTSDVPAGVEADLLRLVQERGAILAGLARRLERGGPA